MTEEREAGEAERPRPWEVVSEEECGDFEMFRARRLRARSPRDGAEHVFHVAESPDGVVVVAVTDDGALVMVEQFRHGTGEVTLETPSGIVDPGEKPEDAARRELREETGYGGGEVEIVGEIDVNPSWQRARVLVAVIRGVARMGPKDEDEAEEIRPRLLSAEEVWGRVRRGGIRSAVAVAALALWRDRAGGGP